MDITQRRFPLNELACRAVLGVDTMDGVIRLNLTHLFEKNAPALFSYGYVPWTPIVNQVIAPNFHAIMILLQFLDIETYSKLN